MFSCSAPTAKSPTPPTPRPARRPAAGEFRRRPFRLRKRPARFSTGSISPSLRARRWQWSARRAPANRPWPACSTASRRHRRRRPDQRPRPAVPETGQPARGHRHRAAGHGAVQRQHFLQHPGTGARRPTGKPSMPPPRRPAVAISSNPCRRNTKPGWANGPQAFRRGKTARRHRPHPPQEPAYPGFSTKPRRRWIPRRKKAIQGRLELAAQGRTTLVIAHRLSTV